MAVSPTPTRGRPGGDGARVADSCDVRPVRAGEGCLGCGRTGGLTPPPHLQKWWQAREWVVVGLHEQRSDSGTDTRCVVHGKTTPHVARRQLDPCRHMRG